MRTIIYRRSAGQESSQQIKEGGPVNGPVNGPVSGLVNGLVSETVKGQVFWQEGSLDRDLYLQPISPAVLQVLDCVKNNPGCRQNAIARSTGISERRIKRYITELKKKKLVEFRGAPKNGGYWMVKRSSK